MMTREEFFKWSKSDLRVINVYACLGSGTTHQD